jgi:predicted nucleic acid-binding protein
MTLADELSELDTVFMDTAPIIYHIEAHSVFGALSKEIFDFCQNGKLSVFSSVITLAEVLPKPVEIGNNKLARKFAEFLRYGKNIRLIEISANVAEKAGKLRGKYSSLKTMDALQIAASLDTGADALITNDVKFKQISEIKAIVLKDYLR